MNDLLFNKLFDNLGNAENLPKDHPLKDLANRTIKVFDMIVDFHRQKFPNPNINKLMATFWRLVGNKITPAAITDEALCGLHFYCEVRKNGDRLGVVVIPNNWLDMVKENPVYQAGGTIFIASQAQDYFNERYGAEFMGRRAAAYEAEFLKTVKETDENHKFNEYQQKVLSKYPLGLESLETEFKYETKEWSMT